MKSFAEILAEDRRLGVLRLLAENGGEAGESVLEKGLVMLGHGAGLTRDLLREDLRFLKDADCLVTDLFADKVMIGKITRRGVDASEGKITVAGVAQPQMGL